MWQKNTHNKQKNIFNLITFIQYYIFVEKSAHI